MSLCRRCSVGGYHGFPTKDAPEWDVGTIYFYCPWAESHDDSETLCTQFRRGEPRMYDKHGKEKK